MGITTEKMRRYLDYLRRHYRLVTLDEAVELARSGKNSEPAVALTFDDGYAENMRCLRAAFYGTGARAAFFVSSAYVGESGGFPHDLARGVSGFPPFSWEDLRVLHREGHIIGSHTRTHAACADEGELGEIEASGRELREGAGCPVDFFSFPWGKRERILPRAFEAARLAGYKAAFLADSGDAMDCGGDLFRIERTPLPVSGSLIDLEAALHGWNALAKAKARLARRALTR
jgi:peptidoglycan/xylan/chitin deacetylase (PgdA/CDA1 family)